MTIGDEDVRRGLLDDIALEIGQRLYTVQRDALIGEGRSIAGGWPGTMREARSVVAPTLGQVLARRAMSAATDDELRSVMHAAYGEARRAWMRSADRRQEREF